VRVITIAGLKDLSIRNLFPDRIEPRNVNRSWYVVRTEAGLGTVRLHDLRHSCASFLLAAGISPRTVMKTLGHSQIGLTMNTYAHVLPDIERTAIDAATKTIFG
jgi:integrase